MNDFFNAIMQDVLGWAVDKALDAIWSHWLAGGALGAGETLKGRLEARRRASVRARACKEVGGAVGWVQPTLCWAELSDLVQTLPDNVEV